MESYRAALRAIASELESATGLREQLKDASGLSDFAEAEIESPQIGRWEIRAKLLALGKTDILLGQRADGEFAVIERFRPESLYAKHNGSAEILLQGGFVFVAGMERFLFLRYEVFVVISAPPPAEQALSPKKWTQV